MRIFSGCLFVVSILLAAVSGFTAIRTEESVPVFKMSLEESIEAAIKNSHLLNAVRYDSEGAHESVSSQISRQYPALSIDGSISYMTNVGKIDIAPGQELKLGDNYVYSIGPTLNWVLWDSGRIRNSWKSLKAIEKARKEDFNARKRQTVLEAKASYFATQLGLEQLKLVADSLILAQSQYDDISRKNRAGVSSRIDLISARQQVIDFMGSYKEAQNKLSLQARELLKTVGYPQDFNMAFPVYAVEKQVSDITGYEPDYLIKLDNINDTLDKFNKMVVAPVNIEEQPAVKSAGYQSEAALYAASTANSGHWPVFNFQARSSLDYPNTPQQKKYNQNRVSLMMNFPLFEWGRVTNEIKSSELKAKAAMERKKEIEINVEREWYEIKDNIANLQSRKGLDESSVKEREELAGLIYNSYMAGKSNHLEVERANFRVLEAKVSLARTKAQILVEMARLASLSMEEN